MNNLAARVIIGIGSPHGDDQFGWAVINELQSINEVGVSLRKINHPIDLITDLDTHDEVVLIDAAKGLSPEHAFQKLVFNNPVHRKLIQEIPSSGTHDMGVYETLQLAAMLGKRTDHVTLWIGKAAVFDQLAEMATSTKLAAKQCAATIAKELCDARNVAC
ncbi:MAG: hypothetical protein WBD20_10905 [Pirellulaceae bacterium]